MKFRQRVALITLIALFTTNGNNMPDWALLASFTAACLMFIID